MEVGLNYPSIDSNRIVRWQTAIRIATYGNPNSADLEILRQLTDELNVLIAPIRISLDSSEPNIHLYFVKPQEFQQVEPYFEDVHNPSLNGVTFVYPTSDYGIDKANILISSKVKDSKKRAHIIREELTQSLGLLIDSWKYTKSIFYEGQSYTTRFSSIDEELIQLLYSQNIQRGWTAKQVLNHLCEVKK